MRRLVLVVEDHDDLRSITEELLRYHGFAVVTASNGSEALAAARAHHPALVLLDLQLDGELSGFDVAAALQRDRRERPTTIAAMSAAADDPAWRGRALTAGCDVVLLKPLQTPELLELVGSVLAKV